VIVESLMYMGVGFTALVVVVAILHYFNDEE
jgi:hypothetical protein